MTLGELLQRIENYPKQWWIYGSLNPAFGNANPACPQQHFRPIYYFIWSGRGVLQSRPLVSKTSTLLLSYALLSYVGEGGVIRTHSAISGRFTVCSSSPTLAPPQILKNPQHNHFKKYILQKVSLSGTMTFPHHRPTKQSRTESPIWQLLLGDLYLTQPRIGIQQTYLPCCPPRVPILCVSYAKHWPQVTKIVVSSQTLCNKKPQNFCFWGLLTLMIYTNPLGSKPQHGLIGLAVNYIT